MKNETRIAGLRSLAGQHGCATPAFQWMAGLKNRKSELTVTQLTRRTDYGRRDVVAFLRALGDLGLGELTIGRRGHDTRLVMGAHIAEIGRAALGEIDRISLDYGDIDADEILSMHRQLIAHALECEVEDVRIIVAGKEDGQKNPHWPEDLDITITKPGTSFEAGNIEGETFDLHDRCFKAPGGLEGKFNVLAVARNAISGSDVERVEYCMRYDFEWEGLIVSLARIGHPDNDETQYQWEFEPRAREDEEDDE